MIRRLAEWSVDRRGWVAGATLVLAALAVVVAVRIKLDALPDITSNQVLVLTRAPGLTPEEVERIVTRPIEVALGGVPGLVEHRSISRYGISSVTMVFEDEVPSWQARQVVAERLSTVSFPEGVEPPELGPLTGGLGEIFHLTISSAQRTPSELLELATYRVVPLLKSVPGVVEVNTWGGAQRTLDVVADPAQLAARKMTLGELRDALASVSGAMPGGALPAGSSQVLLRAVARPAGAAELGGLVVKGRSVRTGDLGQVLEGQAVRLGAATANGRGETLYLMVQMLRDDNALEVMRRLHARMPAVRAQLPSDVRLEIAYDRSDLVNGTLRTVAKNLAEGGLLVVVVLLAFLGSLRAGLVVASVIPLSMAFATAGMVVLGIPGNLMSLGALDFGLLVDGAVVLIEGVFHGFSRAQAAAGGPDAMRRRVRAVAGASARPIFFSVLVILLVYVPVLALQGVDGKMFRPMALTVVLALGFALALSFTWVPAVGSIVLRAKDIPARPPLAVRAVDWAYPRLLAPGLTRRRGVAFGAVLLLAVGAVLFRQLGVEFTPQLDEGDLVIQTTRPADISLEESARLAGVLEAALKDHAPEVVQVVSRVGSPAVATDIMGFEQADVFVKLKPRDAWRPGLTREGLVAELKGLIETHAPGGDPSFTQPIQMRFNELLGGAVTDVAVSIYGEELSELHRVAEATAKEIATVPGAADVRVLAPPSVPVTTVRPRPLDAALFSFTPHEVLEAVQAARLGLEVGATWDGLVRIPLRLQLAGASSAWVIGELPLPTATGGLVPLSRIADVRTEQAAGLVNRRNGERRLVVGFNVRGADLGSVVEAAQARLGAALKTAPGYRFEWGGQYENLREATRRLGLVVPAALALILGVLALTFARLRPALVIFLVVPFASVGGVVALWARGMPVSLPAAVGFIALSGIAVMNGVVWMSRALELSAAGQSLEHAAKHASLARARPVLMTALVAAFGFVPMMLAHGVGAEVQRPLATVVVGGLASSTFLTLLVLPALYPVLMGRRKASKEAV